ncbi:MAG TPA: hypothetical protein PLL06_14035 [Acidobacteriota bacterium]|nr:hypothetical protein [Acidobacteriota bacterium]
MTTHISQIGAPPTQRTSQIMFLAGISIAMVVSVLFHVTPALDAATTLYVYHGLRGIGVEPVVMYGGLTVAYGLMTGLLLTGFLVLFKSLISKELLLVAGLISGLGLGYCFSTWNTAHIWFWCGNTTEQEKQQIKRDHVQHFSITGALTGLNIGLLIIILELDRQKKFQQSCGANSTQH